MMFTARRRSDAAIVPVLRAGPLAERIVELRATAGGDESRIEELSSASAPLRELTHGANELVAPKGFGSETTCATG